MIYLGKWVYSILLLCSYYFIMYFLFLESGSKDNTNISHYQNLLPIYALQSHVRVLLSILWWLSAVSQRFILLYVSFSSSLYKLWYLPVYLIIPLNSLWQNMLFPQKILWKLIIDYFGKPNPNKEAIKPIF